MDITSLLFVGGVGIVAYMAWTSSEKKRRSLGTPNGYNMGPIDEIQDSKSLTEYRCTPGLETTNGDGKSCVRLEEWYDDDTFIGTLV